MAEAQILGPPVLVDGVDTAACPHKHGVMSIFVSFPVDDVERSKVFYTAIGWPLVEAMSTDGGACFLVNEDTYVMALSRDPYASVGGTEDLVGAPRTPSPVTISFSLPTRDDVDTLLTKAEAAGARIGSTDDYGFMYQRQFDDPDGYHYSPFWMNPDRAPGT